MRGVDPVDLRANTGVGWLQQRVREGLTGVAEAPRPAADRRSPPPRAAEPAMSGSVQELFIAPDGTARGLYGELIDAGALGPCSVTRASHVEPADDGGWTADLSPIGGPVLGPFPLRSAALAAEAEWLVRNRLMPPRLTARRRRPRRPPAAAGGASCMPPRGYAYPHGVSLSPPRKRRIGPAPVRRFLFSPSHFTNRSFRCPSTN